MEERKRRRVEEKKKFAKITERLNEEQEYKGGQLQEWKEKRLEKIQVCLSVCLPVCLSACLFVCLFVCLSACLFVCLPVCCPLHYTVICIGSWHSAVTTIQVKFTLALPIIYHHRLFPIGW